MFRNNIVVAAEWRTSPHSEINSISDRKHQYNERATKVIRYKCDRKYIG
jgi:hypothetical protein